MTSYYKKHHNSVENETILECCFICKTTTSLKNMRITHVIGENVENYTIMLKKYFSVHLISILSRADTGICEKCIVRLKYVVEFLKKVQVSLESLNNKMRVFLKDKSSRMEKNESHLHDNTRTASNKFQPYFRKVTIDSRYKVGSNKKVLTSTTNTLKLKQITNKKEFSKAVKELSSDSTIYTNKCNNKLIKNELTNQEYVDSSNSDVDGLPNSTSDSGDERWSVKSEEIKIATGAHKSVTKNIHSLPALKDGATICPMCDKQFPKASLLRLHYSSHSANYLCDVCGQTSTTRTSFNNHSQMHGDKLFGCKLCDRKFRTPRTAYVHYKVVHNKVKLFTCYKCPSRFSTSVIRKRHLLKEHGIESQMHKCQHCQMEFFNEYLLRKHVQKEHLNLKSFVCADCDKTFYFKKDLSSHMIKHTGIKSHHCEYCGKSFARKKSLVEHLKIHLNIKDHKCNICGKAFVQKCSLQGHMKLHFKNKIAV